MPSLNWLLPGPHHPHTALPSLESHRSHWTASSYTNQGLPSALGSPWLMLILLILPSNVPSWFSLLRWLHLRGSLCQPQLLHATQTCWGSLCFVIICFTSPPLPPNFTKEERALHHSHRHSRCTWVFNKCGKLSEWPHPSLSSHCPVMMESPRNKEKNQSSLVNDQWLISFHEELKHKGHQNFGPTCFEDQSQLGFKRLLLIA